MVQVTLYTKPGCGLCEEAEEVLETVRARRPFDLVKRNILDDLGDYERYKYDIPVILVGGREVARHHLDEATLQAALGAVPAALAVVVMAKVSEPGRVKTRLMPELSAEQAAGVQRAFLTHLVQRLARMGLARVIVCHDPPEGAAAMRELIGGGGGGDAATTGGRAELCPQSEGDLGARLAAAAAAARGDCVNVLFLGVDAPDVPELFLRRAAEMLGAHDVVLGPADDGGYWTVALRGHVDAAEVFRGIEWSSGRECDQTVAAARRLGYNVGLADRWHDVDRPADLRRLIDRLAGSADETDRALLSRLAAVLPATFFPGAGRAES